LATRFAILLAIIPYGDGWAPLTAPLVEGCLAGVFFGREEGVLVVPRTGADDTDAAGILNGNGVPGEFEG